MDLGKKYALVGAFWGVVVGYGAIAVVTGLGVAFLWLFIYGDSSWPENTLPLLYAVGAVTFVATIGGCGAFGYFYGKRLASRDPAEVLAEHRRANAMAGLLVAAVAVGGYTLYAQDTAMRNQHAHLERLLAERHALAALSVYDRGDRRGMDVAVTARGQRTGSYVLVVTVSDGTGRELHTWHEQLALEPGESRRVELVRYRDLFDRMRELSATSEAYYRGTLTVNAVLTPVLDVREARGLPRHVRQQHLAPDSPFHSTATRIHPVEVEARHGQYWLIQDAERHPVAP
jgi:hypothetical protein